MVWVLIISTLAGYSGEAACGSTSNDDLQHMFSWRTKNNYFAGIPSYLELCKCIYHIRPILIIALFA